MENKLEQLLNRLIERGWRPFGFIVSNTRTSVYTSRYYFFENCADGKTLRQITSKESGLWQFVCENMLINKKWFYGDEYCIAEHCEYTPKYYKFRLIESALKDESELENFLLQNIKIGNED